MENHFILPTAELQPSLAMLVKIMFTQTINGSTSILPRIQRIKSTSHHAWWISVQKYGCIYHFFGGFFSVMEALTTGPMFVYLFCNNVVNSFRHHPNSHSHPSEKFMCMFKMYECCYCNNFVCVCDGHKMEIAMSCRKKIIIANFHIQKFSIESVFPQ